MVVDVGRRSLDELRLSIDHLRAAAVLLARGGWKDASSLWRGGARVALDARRHIERLLAGFSRRRDPQLSLIELPDSIAAASSPPGARRARIWKSAGTRPPW